jgi:hypothetical protein
MTNRHRVNHLGGLIEALPTLFGFMPLESVIVLTTHGERAQIGFRMRLDVAAFASSPEESAQRLADQIAVHHQPDGSIIVVLVTEASSAGHSVIDVLAEALDYPIAAGAVAHGGVVSDWRTGQIHEYTDPSTSVASAMAVSEGQPIMHTREEIVASLAPTHTADRVDEGPINARLARLTLDGRRVITDQARVALVRAAAHRPTRDRLMAPAVAGDPAPQLSRLDRYTSTQGEPLDTWFLGAFAV